MQCGSRAHLGTPSTVVDDALIFSCDGASDPFVAAVNKKTGEILWKTARTVDAKKKFSFSTPLAIHANGRSQVVSPSSGAVYGYDPKDGRELWRVRYAAVGGIGCGHDEELLGLVGGVPVVVLVVAVYVERLRRRAAGVPLSTEDKLLRPAGYSLGKRIENLTESYIAFLTRMDTDFTCGCRGN